MVAVVFLYCCCSEVEKTELIASGLGAGLREFNNAKNSSKQRNQRRNAWSWNRSTSRQQQYQPIILAELTWRLDIFWRWSWLAMPFCIRTKNSAPQYQSSIGQFEWIKENSRAIGHLWKISLVYRGTNGDQISGRFEDLPGPNAKWKPFPGNRRAGIQSRSGTKCHWQISAKCSEVTHQAQRWILALLLKRIKDAINEVQKPKVMYSFLTVCRAFSLQVDTRTFFLVYKKLESQDQIGCWFTFHILNWAF